MGVMANAVDNECTRFFYNTASVHTPITCEISIGSVPAGSGSVQLRWRRVSGTGTLQMDANDWISITVRESD
jgi:hypothetical protein